MPAAAECLYYFAESGATRSTARRIPVADNAFTYTLREPVGVVGAITPWNFPLMLGDVEDRARRWRAATRSSSSRPRTRR